MPKTGQKLSAEWLETPNDHFNAQKYLQKNSSSVYAIKIGIAISRAFMFVFFSLFGVANICQVSTKKIHIAVLCEVLKSPFS